MLMMSKLASVPQDLVALRVKKRLKFLTAFCTLSALLEVQIYRLWTHLLQITQTSEVFYNSRLSVCSLVSKKSATKTSGLR